MRRGLFICLMLGCLTACKKEEPHLPPSRMEPILADLHVADAYSTMVRDSLHPNGEKNYDSLAVWTSQILARHKVSLQDFNQSMDWYRDHPVELDSVYARSIQLLEKHNR